MPVSLNRFVITADFTVPVGTAATVVAGEPGTGGASGFGGAPLAAGQVQAPWPTSVRKNQVILLDSGTPSPLYTALNTAGVLRAFVDGTDAIGHQGLSN
jgi:hypothetical protein